MGGPVGQRDPQPGHRVTAERALGQGVPAAGLHRADVLLRHPSADDGRAEHEVRRAAVVVAALQRLHVEDDMGELARRRRPA